MQACASLSAQPAGERRRQRGARSDTTMVGVPRPERAPALTHPAGAVGARTGFRGTAVAAAPRSTRPSSRRCKQVGWVPAAAVSVLRSILQAEGLTQGRPPGASRRPWQHGSGNMWECGPLPGAQA